MPKQGSSKFCEFVGCCQLFIVAVLRVCPSHRLRHRDAEIQSQSWLIVRKFRLYASILSDRTSTLKFNTANRAASFLLKICKGWWTRACL